MAGYQNGGITAHTDIYLCDFRIPVAGGVGGIQKSHRFYAVLACAKSQRHQIVNAERIIQCCRQSFVNEGHNGMIFSADISRMLRICSHAFKPVDDHLAE